MNVENTIKRIAITGPTGAIGIAIIEKCISEGIEVLAICHKGSKRISHLPSSPLVTVLSYDLSEYGQIDASQYESCDAFYHLAWNGTFGNTRNDMYLQTQNIQYTLDAVQLAYRLRCKKFIGAGSQAEYGLVEGKLSADTKTNPENGYGMAKLCAGHMSRVMCQELGMEHVWTRILSVYGPFDGEATMVMSAIRKYLLEEERAFTKGEQLWDYLYAKDVANAMIAIGNHGKNESIYCIGSGKVRPLKEYIEIIHQRIGSQLPTGIGQMPYGPRQVMHLQADITALTADTGFVPQYSFEEGIEETIRWYKESNRY